MKQMFCAVIGTLISINVFAASIHVPQEKVKKDLAQSLALQGALAEAKKAGPCRIMAIEIETLNEIHATYACGTDNGTTSVTLTGFYIDASGPLLLRNIEFGYFD